MTLRRFFLFACIYAFFGRDGARAQNTQPLSTPNAQCAIAFQFPSGAGNSRVLDNRGAACLSFTLTVSVPSTVSALSLVVQTAQDNGSANCSTCSWATYTAATGSNPLTSITGGNATFVTAAGASYFEYLRVQLTSVTGTGAISGQLQGFMTAGPINVTVTGGGGCAGTAGTPCIVAGPDATGVIPTKNPVLVAGFDSEMNIAGGTYAIGVDPTQGNAVFVEVLAQPVGVIGSTGINTAPTGNVLLTGVVDGNDRVQLPFECTLSAPITIAGSGNTTMVPGTVGLHTRLCGLSLLLSAPSNIQLLEGTLTATPCDTGPFNLTGVLPALLSWDVPWSGSSSLGTVTVADDICISVTSAVTGGGVAIYANTTY
jgi:hypothetical protein